MVVARDSDSHVDVGTDDGDGRSYLDAVVAPFQHC
jgi:hypothetical protein